MKGSIMTTTTTAPVASDVERKATSDLRTALRTARKTYREAVDSAKVTLAKAECDAYMEFSEVTGKTA